MTDRLEEMFKLQWELQDGAYQLCLSTLPARPDERAQFVRDNILAATDELHEALNETGWKPWATSRHYDTNKVIAELVDAWHFIMNVMLASGLAPEVLAKRFHEQYLAKNRVNARRQVEGYDGVSTKCPHCKRDLEEVDIHIEFDANEKFDYAVCDGCENVIHWLDLPHVVRETLA